MKAIIFARVSTPEQKEEGQSIPAQVTKMREYCAHKNIPIGVEYEIDESSTKDERKKFEQVIEQIKNGTEKVALIIETIDRLQRSFKESVVLDELRKKDLVEIHFLRENLVISVNSNSSDLLRWDMGVMFARGFVLQLSDNVKRTIEEKLRNGEWPGKAPYGYKNITLEDGKKNIVVGEYEAKIVQKVFEWYGTSAFSMDLVRQKLKSEYGLTWSKGAVDKVLKETFYFGIMEMKGKFYPHKYPPIITQVTFDIVQQIKAGHNKKKFKYAGLPYIYRGLIRCSHCGCAVTPEKHKGHIYYHCTQYKGKHGAEWLREEEITNQLGAVFQKMLVPRKELDRIINGLKSVHEGKVEFREEQVKQLTREHEKYAKMTEALYLDKLQGRITDNEYDKYYQSFREKISGIDTRLAILQEAEDNYYITAKYVLEVASRAYDLFIGSEIEEKRQLLKLALLNLRMDGKMLRYEVIKPFDTIVQCNDSLVWLPGSDSNRQPSGYTLSIRFRTGWTISYSLH